MITEDYVSFETAKLLKEKGFDGFCERFYDYYPETGEVHICGCDEHDNNRYDDEFSMPTQQMAMRWLREVHHIAITFHSISFISGAFLYKPFINCYGKYSDYIDNVEYPQYEEAVESALKYALVNLITE